MSEFERVMRASSFCHSMAMSALMRGDLHASVCWSKHAKTYSSAARLMSKAKHRKVIKERREAMRMGTDCVERMEARF